MMKGTMDLIRCHSDTIHSRGRNVGTLLQCIFAPQHPHVTMSTKKTAQMQLDCTECRFSKRTEKDGEKLPAEIVREHGKNTGHKVRVSLLEK